MKALQQRIKRVEEAKHKHINCGVQAPSKVAWFVWGSRTSNEQNNNHRVQQ